MNYEQWKYWRQSVINYKMWNSTNFDTWIHLAIVNGISPTKEDYNEGIQLLQQDFEREERRNERNNRKYLLSCMEFGCRRKADRGIRCIRHQKLQDKMISEAVKHPEKWVLQEKVINNKTYRDFVYTG
jgi:hypothetical protein